MFPATVLRQGVHGFAGDRIDPFVHLPRGVLDECRTSCGISPGRRATVEWRWGKRSDEVKVKVKAPVMIDTTDPTAIELALTYCQGKAIIIDHLEDGEEKSNAGADCT